jgi:predicted kinase
MSQNLKVIICCGIPASGKSTWAIEHCKYNPAWVRVNRDSYRKMLKDAQMCEPKVEDLITDLQNHAINAALNKRLNVIVDNTNLKAKYIEAIVELVKTKADVEFRIFDISLDKAIERDAQREAKVGEKVIRDMFKDYQRITDGGYNFVNMKQQHRIYNDPVRNSNLSDVVLFDIDGTLAHMNGKRGPFEWHNVHRDDVDTIVARQAKMHLNAGDSVFIMSGRDGSCRKETEEWLELHGIQYNQLLMRAPGDMRKDSIIKKELYAQHIDGKFNVLVVYDDRDQVVTMWRNELGLKVFQVNPGDF